MSTMTIDDIELHVAVPDGASEDDWHDGRAAGVTASEIHDIANGSRKAWRTILDAKLNGSTFRGNQHTKRGHEREAEIIRQAADLDGVHVIGGSHALIHHATNPLHLATPDGFGLRDLGPFGVEGKSRNADYEFTTIPAENCDQMQWGMHVSGFDWWLYVWEIDGIPGIFHRWVPRDDKRITQLVEKADQFIAWRAAGAPEIDDIPDDIDDALSTYDEGLALCRAGEKLKKTAKPLIEIFAAAAADQAKATSIQRAGTHATVLYGYDFQTQLTDEEWAEADPAGFEAYLDHIARAAHFRDLAATARQDATDRYGTARQITTFSIRSNGPR